MTMHPNVRELNSNPNYRLIKTLDHKEVLPFVLTYIKRKNATTLFFYGFNVLLIAALLYLLITNLLYGHYSWGSVLFQMALAVGIGFTLIIPVHEGIHALVYKILGAKNIRFGADLKHLVFYATADQYVTPKHIFLPVALSPFLLVIIACLSVIFIGSLAWSYFAITFMLIHSSMCTGDFALLSFYAEHANEQIYTYDDAKQQMSYFYKYIGD